jgi:hypothetical protein
VLAAKKSERRNKMPKLKSSKKSNSASSTKKTATRRASPKSNAAPRATTKKLALKPATKKKAAAESGNAQAPSFQREIQSFITHIESLSKALELTMSAIVKALKESSESIGSFIKKKGVRRTRTDGSDSFMIKPDDFQQFERRIATLSSASLAVTNIPQIFLCSLVHKYDAYLGGLLRVAFAVKPEILSASEKTLTYADLAKFSSLTAAREALIEREVESIIRDSHSDHFDWMEKRFDLPLRKDLEVWPQFVEITERRNLFVHCDGIVSSQYIAVCRKHGGKLDDSIKAGDQLTVNSAYFQTAFACMLEIGIKLGHVFWRKLQPSGIKEADIALQETGYDLLVEERYDLAKMILRFATNTLKSVSSDRIRRMNIINLCIAHKFSGDEQNCMSVLDSEDWTACSPEFRLAVEVLTDNFTAAAKIMEAIGKDGAVTREYYSTWPLFKKFRESTEFLTSYRKLFGAEFVVPEDIDIPNTQKPTKASRRRPKGRA